MSSRVTVRGGTAPPAKHFSSILRVSGVDVGGWRCTHQNRDPGPEQLTSRLTINVATRGIYALYAGTRTVRVDPTVVVYSNPGEVWRTAHPAGQGDEGLWVQLSEDSAASFGQLIDDRGRFLVSARPLSAAAWLRIRQLRSGAPMDEAGLVTLVDLLRPPAAPTRRGTVQARRITRVLCEALSRPGPPPDHDTLAELVGVSRFAAWRAFRQVTGVGPHDWAIDLRLRLAADRVMSGPVDLAELAQELGFSSHSHLTARFRARFGLTPSALRAAQA